MSSLPWYPPWHLKPASPPRPCAVAIRRLSALWPPTLADGREMAFSTQDGMDRAMLTDREHNDRHTVFLSKRERGCIHDLQPPIHGFLMVEMIKTGGFRIMFGICGIDAVDVSRL